MKNPPTTSGDARDEGLILESGRTLGVGNGNPRQDSCLEYSMDRGTWQARLWNLKESDMTEHTHVELQVLNPRRIPEM